MYIYTYMYVYMLMIHIPGNGFKLLSIVMELRYLYIKKLIEWTLQKEHTYLHVYIHTYIYIYIYIYLGFPGGSVL